MEVSSFIGKMLSVMELRSKLVKKLGDISGGCGQLAVPPLREGQPEG